MTIIFNPLITDAGMTAATTASGLGLQLSITHIALGSGSYTPVGSLTALSSYKEKATVAGGFLVGVGGLRIDVLFPALTGAPVPYNATEIGFYAGDPDAGGILFAVHSHPVDVIVQRTTTLDYVAQFGLQIARVPSGSISIIVDTSVSQAIALLNTHEASTNPHPNYAIAQPLGGIDIGPLTLNHATPDGRISIPGTNPNGWNANVGRMTVDMEFVSNNYFAANPGGHFAIVLRQDPALIATAVRGQGVAVGNATGFAQPSDLNPTPMLETWFNGIGTGGFLWANSDSARNFKMADGVTYRIIVDSIKTNEGARYLRYRLWSLQGVGYWRAEVDTGDVLDHNVWADLTKSGFVLGHVFESNLSTWSLAVSKCNVTWGPAEHATPDQTTKLSRYGAQLEGDLTFINAARRIKAPANAGPSLLNSPTFQSSTLNTATTYVVKPNGSSTTANFLFSNNSSSDTTYGAVSVGMNGANAEIQSFGYAAANPGLNINIGVGNTVARFTASGIAVLGAGLPIGQAASSITGLNSYGGAYAVAFCTAAMNLETFCTTGQISSFMSSTPTNGQVENITRPAYCMISCIINELKSRKVF